MRVEKGVLQPEEVACFMGALLAMSRPAKGLLACRRRERARKRPTSVEQERPS
jgi:hypothetical protein